MQDQWWLGDQLSQTNRLVREAAIGAARIGYLASAVDTGYRGFAGETTILSVTFTLSSTRRVQLTAQALLEAYNGTSTEININGYWRVDGNLLMLGGVSARWGRLYIVQSARITTFSAPMAGASVTTTLGPGPHTVAISAENLGSGYSAQLAGGQFPTLLTVFDQGPG